MKLWHGIATCELSQHKPSNSHNRLYAVMYDAAWYKLDIVRTQLNSNTAVHVCICSCSCCLCRLRPWLC
jgi:hypothetical protein